MPESVGAPNAMFVPKFALNLRDRPMTRAPSMADPTQDIPTDYHLGGCDRDFEFGAFCLGVTRAGGIGAVVQLADQLHRSFQRMKATAAVITDVHHPPADGAITIKDIEFPQSKIRILGPDVWHPTGLQAMLKSVDGADQTRGYTRKCRDPSLLADR
jgi:hypothetical protein